MVDFDSEQQCLQLQGLRTGETEKGLGDSHRPTPVAPAPFQTLRWRHLAFTDVPSACRRGQGMAGPRLMLVG